MAPFLHDTNCKHAEVSTIINWQQRTDHKLYKLTFFILGSLAKQTKQFDVYHELLPQVLVGRVA